MVLGDFREKLRDHLPLIGIVALALIARVIRLTWPQIWSDEGYSIFLAKSSLPELFIGTANDMHPPLFYLSLKGWLLPGYSSFYVRLFPVFWGVLTVGLVYIAGKRLFGPVVGLWAGLFLALSPMHIAYSREIRMYAVLVFWGSLSVYLAWCWMEAPSSGAWAGHIAATLMALYTQNLALFILPFVNLAVLSALLFQKRWKDLAHWIAGQFLLFLGYLPWFLVTVYQVFFRQATWIPKGSFSRLRSTLINLAFGEPRFALEERWQIVAYAWLAVVVLGGGITIVWKQRRRRWPALYTWLWLIVPLGLIFGVSLFYSIYQEKQFLLLTVPMALSMGLGVAGLPKFGRVAVFVLFLALIAPSLHNDYFRHELMDHGVEESWEELAAYMAVKARPDDVVLINPGAAEPTLRLSLENPLPVEAHPQTYDPMEGNWAGEKATPEQVDVRLGSLSKRYERIWLVECCWPQFWDPQRLIPAWLKKRCRPVSIPKFPGLEVHLYEDCEAGEGLR